MSGDQPSQGLIQFRPATDSDRQFCYATHKAAMCNIVDRIWGWKDAEQSDYFDRTWDPSHTQIIVVDDRDSGVLVVDHRDQEIYLGRIEIDPNSQGRGIGTVLVRNLQNEAAQRGVPLVLEMLSVNERAEAFYLRLGFEAIEIRGHKVVMRWAPNGRLCMA